jgi:hypothetical protein
LPTDRPEIDAPKDEAPLAGASRVLRIVPRAPSGYADDGRLSSTSPASDEWVAYYAAAERVSIDRDREQALRTYAAGRVVRVLVVVVLALAALGYALLR